MLVVVVVRVRVGLRMRVRVVMVSVRVVMVVMRMLVYRHGPGMRLVKIASRVIIQPDQAVTGDINIGHGSTTIYWRRERGVGRGDIKGYRKIKNNKIK